MTRKQLVAEARLLLNVPYHHQGRGRFGMDCVGVLTHLANVLGVPFQDLQGYDRFGRGVDLAGELRKWITEIDPLEAKPGDVLVFRLDQTIRLRHCGIKTDYGILHTHNGVGKVVEHGLTAEWVSRIVTAFAYPGVE